MVQGRGEHMKKRKPFNYHNTVLLRQCLKTGGSEFMVSRSSQKDAIDKHDKAVYAQEAAGGMRSIPIKETERRVQRLR